MRGDEDSDKEWEKMSGGEDSNEDWEEEINKGFSVLSKEDDSHAEEIIKKFRRLKKTEMVENPTKL